MGSDSHYPEEAPAHRVSVDGFWIDAFQVTNRQFAPFVEADRLRNRRRAAARPDAFPGAPPENLVPGSLVFTSTTGPVDLRHLSPWWTWTPGACWRHPDGPASSIDGREDHPVVHVAYEDAEAYADWAGKALPTEARVGAGCARRPRRVRPSSGATSRKRRRAARELLARRVPLAAGAGLRHRDAGRLVPRQRVRPVRHGRQRLGVDRRTGTPRTSAGGRQAVLRAAEPARAARREELRPRAATVPDPAQGDQGRLVPMRRQLLHALPAGGPAAADDRHRHEPRRHSLCHATQRALDRAILAAERRRGSLPDA